VCALRARDMAAALDDPPAPSITAKRMQRGSCLSCGADLDMSEAEEAQQRIKQLESQVELLTEKATAAGTLTQRSARSSCDRAD
jgi:Ni,Fe-hydrogenase III large subunit